MYQRALLNNGLRVAEAKGQLQAYEQLLATFPARRESTVKRADALKHRIAEIDQMIEAKQHEALRREEARTNPEGALNYAARIAYLTKRYDLLSGWFDDLCERMIKACGILCGTHIDLADQIRQFNEALGNLVANHESHERRLWMYDCIADLVRRVELNSVEAAAVARVPLKRQGSEYVGTFEIRLPDARRPRLRSVFGWLAPGFEGLAIDLDLMPPAVAQVPKLAKRIPEIDGLSDLGDVVSIDQKYAGVITMGPVFAPPSASGKALLDGPNHNVCPLGTWSA